MSTSQTGSTTVIRIALVAALFTIAMLALGVGATLVFSSKPLSTNDAINQQFEIKPEEVIPFCAASGCEANQFSYPLFKGKKNLRQVNFDPRGRRYTFNVKDGYRLAELTGARRIVENAGTITTSEFVGILYIGPAKH